MSSGGARAALFGNRRRRQRPRADIVFPIENNPIAATSDRITTNAGGLRVASALVTAALLALVVLVVVHRGRRQRVA